jgi:hypothetical protein
MEFRADLFRASAAQRQASVQRIGTSAIEPAYLELMQGRRELAAQIERLDRKRPNDLRELWKNLPPKDPHDDDDNQDDDEGEDDNDDEAPAVIREPDEC